MPRRAKMMCVLILLLAAGSLSLRGQSSAISSPGISNGYIAPTSKVGVNDTVYAGLPQFRFDRYSRFQSIGTKLKTYNAFWSEFEVSAAGSSPSPMVCAAGERLVPADEMERVAKGFNRYRCLTIFSIENTREVLREDQNRGIETATVIWGTPLRYRHPQCVGASWAGSPLDVACVPNDDAMDDFEDFVNFLASEYNGATGNGRITHFIIWNEFQSGRWFNYHPIVPWNQRGVDLDQSEIDLLVQKYESMLRRAHEAIYRHARPALMYVSLDNQVLAGEQPELGANVIYSMDAVSGLTGLWSRLSTAVDWSIAIHPYGAPAADLGPVHNYEKLHFLVEWQMQRLLERQVTDPLNRPQTILFASEQGWTFPGEGDHVTRAVYMCQAHDISMKLPPLIGSTHANFQVGQDCQTGAVHNDPYGLIPASAGCNLSSLDTQFIPEWLAYQATSPSNWGRNNSHGCCSALGLGCVAPIAGFVDGVFFENGEYVLRGWACSPGSNESIVVHLYGNGPAGGGGTLAGAYTANLPSEPAVSGANGCRSAGKNYRFRIPLTQWIPQHSGVWLWVHGISPYGAPHDLLPGSGNYRVP